MLRTPYRIVRRPVITERGTFLKEQNKYLFEVDRTANKLEIKHAVETMFNVRVVRVHTVTMKGKVKRLGRFMGRTPAWKKAIVTLKVGDAIEFFESA